MRSRKRSLSTVLKTDLQAGGGILVYWAATATIILAPKDLVQRRALLRLAKTFLRRIDQTMHGINLGAERYRPFPCSGYRWQLEPGQRLQINDPGRRLFSSPNSCKMTWKRRSVDKGMVESCRKVTETQKVRSIFCSQSNNWEFSDRKYLGA